MRIAHLSDVHVLDLSGVSKARFLNKRITGLANLVGARKGAHPPELLERLVDSLLADHIDHVVITGDLSNLALESEFARARSILEPLGGYDRVSVIPGNHDVYTRGSQRARRFERFFHHLMWPAATPEEAQTYPWFKDLGEVKLLGFNSCYPTPPLMAVGSVDAGQLARLGELDLSGSFAVALVHHNLHPRGWRKDKMHGFINRDAMIAACVGAGVALLLHGHTHKAHDFEVDGLRIIGSGSSTWSAEDPALSARYNVYHIDGGRLTRTEVRSYDAASKTFAAGTSGPLAATS